MEQAGLTGAWSVCRIRQMTGRTAETHRNDFYETPDVSFLIPCPNCGPRGVYEFRFGGEVQPRPAPGAPDADWTRYAFERRNLSGVHTEWWYHRLGCRQWFYAARDTTTNEVQKTYLPEA